MTNSSTPSETDATRRSRSQRSTDALVMNFIHELSQRHGGPAMQPADDGAEPPANPGEPGRED
jgi:hypothetical protein